MSVDGILSTSGAAPDASSRYRHTVVNVGDDEFSVGTWQGATPPVLAIHGISSNHLLWSWVAAEDDDLTVIAPDLRGRGNSTRSGPHGLEQHRDDMLALLDVLKLDTVVLSGMSLGGYVAVALAAAAPERFSSVVLVDGGLPVSANIEREKLLAVVQARSASGQQFPDVESYVEHYMSEFSTDLIDDPVLKRFLGWNLDPAGDGFRVNLSEEAVTRDAMDIFFDAPVERCLEQVRVPVHLLHAESRDLIRGASTWADEDPTRSHELAPGSDHASIIMGQRGGGLVAGALRDRLTDPGAAPQI